MALRRLKRICKILFCLVFLLVLAWWQMLWNPAFRSYRKVRRRFENGQRLIEATNGTEDNSTNVPLLALTNKAESLSELTRNIYGSNCPYNPHKETLRKLFNQWMALDNYYNFSSFICGGSLIGSLRDGDLIPYDRDIDVCLTLENYQKVRVLRSRKPFNYRSHQAFLAVQEDFSNNDVWHRTRVDCKGRIRKHDRDPCTFETPGARLISRGVHVDIFVFRERGMFLRDHEYEKEFLKTDIFPTKRCEFMGVKTKCPRDEMALLLKYYEPDVLIKPHYLCQNQGWAATHPKVHKQFEIWFSKIANT